MTMKIGEKLPAATFRIATDDAVKNVSVEEIFAGKKVVLFGVPGAFTPTCSNNHLPGFIDNYDAFLSRGVDRIAVVAVNDPFVMRAWERASGADGKILFLSDGSGDFVKSVGLDADLSAVGFGLRSKRFSMLVEDGKVTALNIEDSPGQAIQSGAARILEQL